MDADEELVPMDDNVFEEVIEEPTKKPTKKKVGRKKVAKRKQVKRSKPSRASSIGSLTSIADCIFSDDEMRDEYLADLNGLDVTRSIGGSESSASELGSPTGSVTSSSLFFESDSS
ncbi:uncharacterized protein LOC117647225 [Thrips palmi]|uniref:Uncharacterized protein LOC117647225 n=1 Tax=Thrips palmi TaxID=161013 RepID=A0A6P8Z4Q1_THRPL|nr:uncharacterized protein LOC117647225 [Thrips palmi]